MTYPPWLKILTVFGCLLVGFNFHVPDFGGTYVSRNILAWLGMGIAIPALFWRPLWGADGQPGQMRWSRVWLAGLFIPVAGAFMLVAGNILGAFDTLQGGHLLFPGMVLTFAVFTFGLAQNRLSAERSAGLLCLVLVAFLPQYLIHFVTTNPLVFFNVALSLPSFLVQEFGGFAQYNLFGTFLVSLILLAIWAFTFVKLTRWQRLALVALLAIYALDFAMMRSKTALLSAGFGLGFMALHVRQVSHSGGAGADVRRRFGQALIVLSIAYALVWAMTFYNPDRVIISPDWSPDGGSVRWRYSMWVIAWRSFLEAPLFGHGLGSFSATYLDHFARYGLADGLSFLANTSLPHNLVMHVLTEMGLVGVVFLLAPLAFLAWFLLARNPNIWLILALTVPVVLHTQFEYPYVASGWHYILLAFGWMVAMQGTRLPERVLIVKNQRFGRASFAFLSLLCLALIYLCASLLFEINRATYKLQLDARQPIEVYIERRYSAAERQHPILGRHITAISDLMLLTRALDENRDNLVQHLALPRFEQNVLSYYSNKAIWDLAMRAYTHTQDVAAMQALITFIAPLQPKVAEAYQRDLEKVFALSRRQAD